MWEHNKRFHLYILKPLIRINGLYYWGAFSVERNSNIWRNTILNHRLPADIDKREVTAVLKKGHLELENGLVEKANEIVQRFTKDTRINFFPHKIDSSISNIGDVDVLAFIKDKNILLNIESKIIDQVYALKDLSRVQKRTFGRTKSDGTFEKGDLHKVEERENYLKKEYAKVMSSLGWQQNDQPPKIVSIFLTKMTYFWTKFPLNDTSVNFVEIRMLNEFISTA